MAEQIENMEEGQQVDQVEQTAQDQKPQPPKAHKLYDSLISDGYTSDNLGTKEEFAKAMSDSAKADKFYSNLTKEGYTTDNLGSKSEFIQSLSQKKNFGQPSKTGAEPNSNSIPTVQLESKSQLEKTPDWEENPLNPLAAANKAQAKKEEAQKIMPQPTPTIGKKVAPVKVAPQRKPITEVPKEDEESGGFWSTASQALFAPLSGNYLKYFYNQVLSGVGEVSSAASDLVMQGLVNVLPQEALGGSKEEVLKQWRNQEPTIREGLKSKIGAELPKEKENEFDNNLLTSAIGGIGRMIPAMASPNKAGIFLQAYDNGVKSVNDSEVGKNLPESAKTIYGTANGIMMKVLMDFQLDKIFGKQAPQVASKITANIFGDLLKSTDGAITKEMFEAAANNTAKGLKSKIISTGGNLVKTGLESTLLGMGFGGIDIASKEILNKSTGKKVDWSETGTSESWKSP
jgi:hypothetical protein